MLAVYGGVGYEPQRRALRRGVDIVVACPGRLDDLVARRDIKLDDVEIVVIDEADRMADMGFLPAVRRILDATPTDRQTHAVLRHARRRRRRARSAATSATPRVHDVDASSRRRRRCAPLVLDAPSGPSASR